MKKLSKEKRNHLVLVVLVTVGVLCGLWFGLIHFQQEVQERLNERKNAAQAKLDKVQQAVRNAERIETEAAQTTRKLAEIEDDMAPNDPYGWMFSKMRIFRAGYKVEIPTISQPVQAEVNLLPQFPYRQATFSMSGTGYYHDVGKFLSELENHYKYFRVVRMDLSPFMPSAASAESEKEKLQFVIDVVTLMKPNT